MTVRDLEQENFEDLWKLRAVILNKSLKILRLPSQDFNELWQKWDRLTELLYEDPNKVRLKK